MKFAKWKNQYIELVSTKPGRIFAFSDEEQSSKDLALLKSRFADFSQIFCEIGCGSGEHLIELARQNPQALCIGLELRFKRVFRSAEKAERMGLNNFIMARFNARKIAELFTAASVDRFYLNFPDPWAKRSQRKHRLIGPAILNTILELLKIDGEFSYKSDHTEYFESTRSLVTKMPEFELLKVTNSLYESPYVLGNIQTEFEKLFISKRLPINFALWKKIRSSSTSTV